MSAGPFLTQATVYLGAAVVAVPLSKKSGLGSVIGYLLAGIAIGPFGLKLIPSTEEVLHFSEFGVVLLLFLIGLELNLSRLWNLRRSIFGTGLAQVVLTTLVFFAIGRSLGYSTPVALVAGMGFSLSSTAIAVQLMKERGILKTIGGETAFSVLLFQDLAVIVMLAIIPVLALSVAGDAGVGVAHAAGKSDTLSAILKPVLAILGIVVVGRYLLRPIFRQIAKLELRELFTAFSLFLVIGIAGLMESVGLSAGLGTFLAGVLLADSEYRHELEIDIEPFKGLLLGLFFIAVGMSIDFNWIILEPLKILAFVVGLVAIKLLMGMALGRTSKLIPRESFLFGLTLSQGGEFAFVLFNIAAVSGVIPEEVRGVLIITVALSMLTTPIAMAIDGKLQVWLRNARGEAEVEREADEIDEHDNPVIIAGYGRFGQVVGRLLNSMKIGATVLEHDPEQIEIVRKFGWKAFYGDATRLDLLHAAGAAQAKIFVIAVDDMDAAMRAAELAREHFPRLKILVRVESRPDAYVFIKKGFDVVRVTMGSALEMSERVLHGLGFSAHEAHKNMLKFKAHDLQKLHESAEHVEDMQTLISMSKQWREELSKLMQDDEKQKTVNAEQGWG